MRPWFHCCLSQLNSLSLRWNIIKIAQHVIFLRIWILFLETIPGRLYTWILWRIGSLTNYTSLTWRHKFHGFYKFPWKSVVSKTLTYNSIKDYSITGLQYYRITVLRITVIPRLSARPLSEDLYYPRFFGPKSGTPNFFQMKSFEEFTWKLFNINCFLFLLLNA